MTVVAEWTAICRVDQLAPERGVAALVDGNQLAVFRTVDGSIYCVGHRDPYSGANVIARGLIGSTMIDGVSVATVASPMYKQAFKLADGHCITDPGVGLGSWQVRLHDGVVEVGSVVESPSGLANA